MVLRDAVIVTKDADGKTHVKETTDPKPGSAALIGRHVGRASSDCCWAVRSAGWPAPRSGPAPVRPRPRPSTSACPTSGSTWFKEAVQPDTVTVALLVDGFDADALVAEAERFTGARLVYANLDPGTLARVEAALSGVARTPHRTTHPRRLTERS